MPEESNQIYVTIEGIVREVKGKTNSESYGDPDGGYIPSDSPQSSYLELKIEGDSPVKRLTFEGSWALFKGDRIRARIDMREYTGGGPEPVETYVRDTLKESEIAKLIELIRNEEVIATYEN